MQSTSRIAHDLVFVGGCHVAGYLVKESDSFVHHVKHFFNTQLVLRLPHTKIEKLAQLIPPAHETKAHHVFLQLGNFEFSASWKHILGTTMGRPFKAVKQSSKTKDSAPPQTASAQPRAGAGSAVGPASSRLAQAWFSPLEYGRVVVGGGLYFLTWVVLRKHGQQFSMLNELIRQNPQTEFICMSPFPCAASAHNALRRLGGWLMKHRLGDHANLQWVDTHRVLNQRESLFLDGIHLNGDGHKLLADHLIAVCTELAKAAAPAASACRSQAGYRHAA